jgi:hypothetical protein
MSDRVSEAASLELRIGHAAGAWPPWAPDHNLQCRKLRYVTRRALARITLI